MKLLQEIDLFKTNEKLRTIENAIVLLNAAKIEIELLHEWIREECELNGICSAKVTNEKCENCEECEECFYR